jgi:hypothetical protein
VAGCLFAVTPSYVHDASRPPVIPRNDGDLAATIRRLPSNPISHYVISLVKCLLKFPISSIGYSELYAVDIL